jgi:hypothetical protein
MLCDKFSDCREWSDERDAGMELRRLCDRSRWVSRCRGKEGNEIIVVEYKER